MKRFRCPRCWRDHITCDKVTIVICQACMIKMEEKEDGRGQEEFAYDQR